MPIKRRTILHPRPEPKKPPLPKIELIDPLDAGNFKYLLLGIDGMLRLFDQRAEAIDMMRKTGGTLWQYLGQEFDPNKPIDPERRTPPTRGML